MTTTPTEALAPELDPVVVRDVFPAQVVIGADIIRPARVVITRERLYAYVAGPDGITVALEVPHVRDGSDIGTPGAPRTRAARVQLADGRTAVASGVSGCGCGNPLKVWPGPFTPMRRGPLD